MNILSLQTLLTNKLLRNSCNLLFTASLPPLCAIFGSLMIALPMELFGRRLTLATISIPYILGFYLMGLSYYVNWTPLLFIGRVITGVLTGASAPTSQIYVIPLFVFRFLFPTLILDNSAISALYLNNFITSMSNR
jgi:MFS family permease